MQKTLRISVMSFVAFCVSLVSAFAAEPGSRISLGGKLDEIHAWVEIHPSAGNKMKAVAYVGIPESVTLAAKTADRGEASIKTVGASLRESNAPDLLPGRSEEVSFSGLSRIVGTVRDAVRERRRRPTAIPAAIPMAVDRAKEGPVAAERSGEGPGG